MLFLFIRERLAWIGFFVFLLVVLNILFSLDVGLVGISIWYVNMIMIVAFFIFLLWRYTKEIGQLKDFLGNVDSRLDDAHARSLALSPFQEAYYLKIEDVFYDKDAELNHTKVQLQEYSDE